MPATPPLVTPHPAELAGMVADMARGQRAALPGLIAVFGRRLTSYCARALDRPEDAEDAVQEVFLKAWTAAARYDPAKGAVSTWLYRIALRHCIDCNRRNRLRQFFGLTAEPAEVADDAPDALRNLAAREDAARIRQAIAALPDRQRQALLLKVVAEMDNSAIAATMDCGIGAVEQLLVRARASLRAKVQIDLTLD